MGYLIAEILRLIIGAGVAWAVAASGQIATPIAAMTIGIATPMLVERLARAVPLAPPGGK